MKISLEIYLIFITFIMLLSQSNITQAEETELDDQLIFTTLRGDDSVFSVSTQELWSAGQDMVYIDITKDG